ncbi:hypothetical protein ACFSM5_05545 [Lacibacterium aquatile]|uniref:Glycosyltransferase RgtA/B/C/D-like domain-containing protein n=1 Tax=Lacibacterium aquatile TaxID=1168082 RepID=A0ABW5DPD7_9PROT
MQQPFRLLLLILVGLPALHGIAALWPPMNHDAAAILHWAQRMLMGETLYRDMTDVNPPLIFWISSIPAAFANLTGLPAGSIYNGFFAILASASVAGFLIQLPPERRLPLGAAAILAAFALPQHSFGQREHLLFLSCLPYLAAADLRWRGLPFSTRHAIAVALPAAIGICVKPHFLLVPILIEGALLIRRGVRESFRDHTPFAMISVGVLYIGAAWLFARPYLTEVLPTGLNYYAVGDGLRWSEMLTERELLLVAIPLALVSPFLRRAGGLAIAAGLFTLGAGIAGTLQAKGWDYHFLAARQGLVLSLAAVALSFLKDRRALVIIVVCALTSVSWYMPGRQQAAFAGTAPGRIAEFLHHEAHGKTLLWLSTSITPQYPALIQAKARSLAWPMSLWLMGEVYEQDQGNPVPFHAPSAMPPAEHDLWRHTVDELVRQRPALIVVTDPRLEAGFDGRDFDWLGWLTQDTEAAAALKDYRRIEAPDGLIAYRLN